MSEVVKKIKKKKKKKKKKTKEMHQRLQIFSHQNNSNSELIYIMLIKKRRGHANGW